MGQPWLPLAAIAHLQAYLQPHMRVFEWGAGNSTQWYAERTSQVSAVEHDEEWCHRVWDEMQVYGGAVRILLRPTRDAYVDAIDSAGTYHLVAIDGRWRVRCAQRAAAHVVPGGWLLLDNSDRPWYQPVFDQLRNWPSVTLTDGALIDGRVWTTTVWTRDEH